MTFMVLKDVGPAPEFSTPVDLVEANLTSVFVEVSNLLLLYKFFDSIVVFSFFSWVNV